MVILLRRLLVSMLVPFLWKRWRNRRTDPSDAAGSRRSVGRAKPGPIAAGRAEP